MQVCGASARTQGFMPVRPALYLLKYIPNPSATLVARSKFYGTTQRSYSILENTLKRIIQWKHLNVLIFEFKLQFLWDKSFITFLNYKIGTPIQMP